MTKKQRHVTAVGLLLAILVALFFFLRERKSAPPQSGTSASGTGRTVAETTTLPRRVSGQPGALRAYHIELDNNTVIDTGAMLGNEGASEQTMELGFEGTWLLQELSSDSEDILVHAQLVLDKLKLINSESPVPEDMLGKMKETLALSLVIRYGADGRVLGIRVPPLLDTDPSAFMPIKMLIASMQIVYGSEAVDSWQVTEDDATGAVVARYQWGRNGVLDKHKLDYVTQPPGETPTIGNGLDVSSKLTASYGLVDKGWIAKATYSETSTLKLEGILGATPGQGDFSMFSNTDIHAALLSAAPRAIAALTPEWTKWPERPLADSTMQSRRRLELDPEYQLALTIDVFGVIDSLAKLGDRTEDVDNRVTLEQLLAMALQARPSEIDKLVDKILDGTYDNAKAADVMNALSSAGSPEAQAGLAKIMDAKDVDEGIRQGGVWSFHGVETPTVESLEALRKGMDEYQGSLQSTSLLAYGRVAGNMDRDPSVGDAEAAAAAVRELISRFRRESDPHQRSLLLDALGNSGHPLALPIMLEIIGQPGHALRVTAIRGLRFMPVGQADQVLRGLLPAPDSIEDRSAAVYAISFRDFSSYAQVLMERIKVEPAAEVAVAIFQLIGARINYPEVASFVEWLRENAMLSEVRAAAAELLSPSPPAGQ